MQDECNLSAAVTIFKRKDNVVNQCCNRSVKLLEQCINGMKKTPENSDGQQNAIYLYAWDMNK